MFGKVYDFTVICMIITIFCGVCMEKKKKKGEIP